MRCISRVTDDTYSQKFGNNHNKFYIECRCNLPTTSDICSRCMDKSGKVQTSRKFNHGTIHEPIPDSSHIYGSKWYYDAVKKYGEPSNDSITLAQQYQRDARGIEMKPENQEQIKKRAKPKVSKPKVSTPDMSKPDISTQMVCKEISIPTHIETKMEETEGCDIEYIKVNKVELNGTSYFKDKKNKLYKNINDKIGTYIGRLHDSSIVDIPDSDDET